VTADLDTPLTALHVLADEILPRRPRARRNQRVTDAELVCLAVAQILLDCPSEQRFLRFATRRLGHLFPYLPKQPGYNKRVRALAPQIVRLLNTVALWLHTARKRLGEHLALLEDPHTEPLLSAASSWEIAIKYAAGRLPLPEPPRRYVPSRMRAIEAVAVPIEHSHALAVAALEPLHRDPFDRLLVAQARALDVPILTADPVVAGYPVRTLLVGAG